MEVQLDKLLNQVTNFIQKEANSETVIGKPFKLGEFSCIPVVQIGMGFGTGGGENDVKSVNHNEGAGLGAGMGIQPIGFLVSRGDSISFINAKKNSGLGAAFEKVPELIEKYFEHKDDAVKAA